MNNNLDIELSLKNYYDLKLSNINLNITDCNDSNPYDLISSFIFNGEPRLISQSRWEEYSLDDDLCEPSHENNNGYFTLKQVTGDTFCYQINNNNFLGGFYQGYFKTEGYQYQVLPHTYANGVSFEFWLKPHTGNTTSCVDKFLLNEFNENNKGFFFYYGLKEENPYCGKMVTGETCENVPFTLDYQDNTIYPWQTGNTFLYYTEANYCNPPAYEQIFTYPDCCNDIVCNSLGIRLTDEGAFNVRYVGSSGECINNEFSSDKVLFDYYSSTGLTSTVEWNHVVLKFSQFISTDECDKYREAKQMLLSIWVDGKNVYEVIVPELKPYGLDIHRSLQVGIPYNISVGGGTLGNLENDYLNNESESVNGCSYSLCYRKDNNASFLGYYVGDAFFEVSLDLDENLAANLMEIFDGEAIVTYNYISESCTQINITINTSKNLTSVKIGGEILNMKKNYCYTVTTNDTCNHLAEYFAGSFEGQINEFNIYEKALKIQEINCIYELKKEAYGKRSSTCCI